MQEIKRQLRLRVTNGPDLGREIMVAPGNAERVGRTGRVEHMFPNDIRMSRVHFLLRCDGEKCQLRDLRSSNGTTVNGDRVVEQFLNDQDEVQAGETRFVVSIEEVACQELEPEENVSLSTLQSRPVKQRPLNLTNKEMRARFATALADDEDEVRQMALLAAVWTQQPWLLRSCREALQTATPNNWEMIYLLAVLGSPEDLGRIRYVAKEELLGPRRFELLGAYGHPGVVDLLLEAIGSNDPAVAIAAGTAFTRITGADIDSSERVQLPPEDGPEPDEVEEEFLDEAFLPSLDLAEKHWSRIRDRLSECMRLSGGFDLSGEVLPEVLAELDMKSRWETLLRERYLGRFEGSLADLEVFPLNTATNELTANGLS